MTIENVNTIDERRSKIARNKFSIAICRQSGDKWQIKNTVSSVFGPHSSIVKNVFDCPLSAVMLFVDPCDNGGWMWVGMALSTISSESNFYAMLVRRDLGPLSGQILL